MVSRGRLFDLLEHAGFVAEDDGEWLGYATYEVEAKALEVTVLESLSAGRGVGSALLAACVRAGVERGVDRVWLVTTNDNLDALRFYQRRGWVLAGLHRDSVTRARESLKPEIPFVGKDGIAIRDEIELELPAGEWASFTGRYAWPLS